MTVHLFDYKYDCPYCGNENMIKTNSRFSNIYTYNCDKCGYVAYTYPYSNDYNKSKEKQLSSVKRRMDREATLRLKLLVKRKLMTKDTLELRIKELEKRLNSLDELISKAKPELWNKLVADEL